MHTVAKLASRLNWRRLDHATIPQFYVLTDQDRFTDPLVDILGLLHRLPRGAGVVVRHRDKHSLEALAKAIVPPAHRLGMKVLLAGDIRLALKCRCDGVHVSQTKARLGPLRIVNLPPGFIITAAAHDGPNLRRAERMGAHTVMVSPVFSTLSHPQTKPLGLTRFYSITACADQPIIALGGISARTIKRLRLGAAYGIAAIGAWRD
jgi:thiamine-phosphate pyrophosphorylase